MIKQNGPDGAIIAQIIFVWGIVAMPRDNVQGGLADLGFMELSAPFHGQGGWCFTIFERGDWGFEIAWVCKAIRTNRTPRWQFEFLSVIFTDKAAAWTL